jgi:hypothetical protein
MPPISTRPKGPVPIIIGSAFSGSGMPCFAISAMSAIPALPIAMYPGTSALIFGSRSRCSTPIRCGTSCPMAFMV